MSTLTIGQLARAAAVSIETVRFYERCKLIVQPSKPTKGVRAYPVGTVGRIHFIRKTQNLGFSLREIAELLSIQDDPKGACVDVLQRARDKLSEVERKMSALVATRHLLLTAIDACRAQGPASRCPILKIIIENAHEPR